MARCGTLSFLVLGLTAAPATAQVFTTNASSAGTWFNPGVRGQAVPATPINRSDWPIGVNGAYAVSNGSSIRGVAGGLEADTFNWKNRNYDPTPGAYNYYGPRAGSLEWLRASRDYNADLYITANIRGLVRTDSTDPANLTQTFYDTSIPTLTTLAADWVRYTNHIVQTYRQGQTITDTRDKAILDSLQWSSSVPGDNYDKLLNSAEGQTPKVKYWEIGNEPRVGLSSSYKVTNSYTFFAPPRAADSTHKTDFVDRYKSLTTAMLAEDPTIKVGPAMQWLSAVTEQEILTSLLQRQSDGKFLQVDFLGYHPYQTLAAQTTTATRESYLRGIYNDHLSKVNGIRNIISAAGRDPNSIALVASEHNVSNWSSNGTTNEANMAHALGNTETVFSFARLGLQGAHYWLFPTDQWDGTKFPVDLANEKLRDHMGDTILASSADSADNLHLYSTRSSATGETSLWGLNFSNSANIARSVPITNVGGRGKITMYRLGNPSGATTLDSAIIPSYWAGGPVNGVAWTTSDLTGTRLDTLNLTFNASTITLITIDKWRQMSLPGDVDANGVVNSADTAFITANLNQNERNWWQGDVTGDGLVNAADAAIVSANQGVAVGTKWKLTGGGTWTTSSNWTPATAPNSTTASAYFGNSATGPAIVTTSSNVSLTQLVIDNPSAHTLAASGAGLYTLTNSSTSGTAKVFVVQGAHTISGPVSFARSTTVDIADGSTLTFSGSSAISSGKTINQTGAGTLTITGVQTHSATTAITNSSGTLNLSTNAGGASLTPNLTLNIGGVTNINAAQTLAALNVTANGVARVKAPSTTPIAVKTKSLTVATTGTLDLANNSLIVDYTAGSNPAATIEDLVKRGYNGGSWQGVGGVTSSKAADPLANGSYALAIADNALLTNKFGDGTNGKPLFAGQAVDDTSILVKFTHRVDLDLDGAVTPNDAIVFATNYLQGGGGTWMSGDVNYDGLHTQNDAIIFATFYNGALPSLPEPAFMLSAASALCTLMLRRRSGQPRR